MSGHKSDADTYTIRALKQEVELSDEESQDSYYTGDEHDEESKQLKDQVAMSDQDRFNLLHHSEEN